MISWPMRRRDGLPPVVFYKPQGNFNQHPGYA